MKGARTLMSKKGTYARVVQVLLCSVPGRLTRTQVIADVDISTVVHSLKVERGTKQWTISCALFLRADERLVLKRSSCILSEDNFEAETITRSGRDEVMCLRLLVFVQMWGLFGSRVIDLMI